MLNLKAQKKSIYCFKQNKKAININKFDNILRKLLLKLLLNNTMKQKNINKYTTILIKVLKKTIKDSIL